MLPGAIANAAYDAGVRDLVDLTAAVAIALAESGGNEKAHNAVPPDDKYGLWQIQMYGAYGEGRRGQFGITSNDALYDPLTNAKAMATLSGGGKHWESWTTYKGLRYIASLPIASAAAQGVMLGKGAQKATDAATAPLDNARAALDMASKAGAWVSRRENWYRVAKVGAGLALVVGGVLMATRPILKGAATTIVQTALPIGKAGKAAAAVGGMKK